MVLGCDASKGEGDGVTKEVEWGGLGENRKARSEIGWFAAMVNQLTAVGKIWVGDLEQADMENVRCVVFAAERCL